MVIDSEGVFSFGFDKVILLGDQCLEYTCILFTTSIVSFVTEDEQRIFEVTIEVPYEMLLVGDVEKVRLNQLTYVVNKYALTNSLIPTQDDCGAWTLAARILNEIC
jgi:hypothetical protein